MRPSSKKPPEGPTFRPQPTEWGWLWRGRLNAAYRRLAPERDRAGSWGEWVALLHLRRLRWDVLARNWQVKKGELDLIAFQGKTLVFVEVKTRSGKIRPEENFTPEKQRQMEVLANQFRSRYELLDEPFRCDLIAVETVDFHHFEIRHWIL